jgi:hypothetical protein
MAHPHMSTMLVQYTTSPHLSSGRFRQKNRGGAPRGRTGAREPIVGTNASSPSTFVSCYQPIAAHGSPRTTKGKTVQLFVANRVSEELCREAWRRAGAQAFRDEVSMTRIAIHAGKELSPIGSGSTADARIMSCRSPATTLIEMSQRLPIRSR